MFRPFNPLDPVRVTTANLPHWSQRGATYFVTFRLKDSLPQGKLRNLRLEREAWLTAHPPPRTQETKAEYARDFGERFQAWLDAGTGSCLFADDLIKQRLLGTLWHFAGEQYLLDEHIVAANHVHVVVQPLDSWKLPDITHAWKSCSARRIGRGPIWQKESYDHVVRDLADLQRIREYIRAHS